MGYGSYVQLYKQSSYRTHFSHNFHPVQVFWYFSSSLQNQNNKFSLRFLSRSLFRRYSTMTGERLNVITKSTNHHCNCTSLELQWHLHKALMLLAPERTTALQVNIYVVQLCFWSNSIKNGAFSLKILVVAWDFQMLRYQITWSLLYRDCDSQTFQAERPLNPNTITLKAYRVGPNARNIPQMWAQDPSFISFLITSCLGHVNS
jgi:hypothetical protein